MASCEPVPAGFSRFALPSPYLGHIGPVYEQLLPEGRRFGMRIAAHHQRVLRASGVFKRVTGVNPGVAT